METTKLENDRCYYQMLVNRMTAGKRKIKRPRILNYLKWRIARIDAMIAGNDPPSIGESVRYY